MRVIPKPNFLLTLSDLFVNLSAGWFGAVLIFPGIWKSADFGANLVVLLNSLLYGVICLWGSYYLKELINHAN